MHCSPKKGTDGLTDTDRARDGNAINEASISGQKSDRRKKGGKKGGKEGRETGTAEWGGKERESHVTVNVCLSGQRARATEPEHSGGRDG